MRISTQRTLTMAGLIVCLVAAYSFPPQFGDAAPSETARHGVVAFIGVDLLTMEGDLFLKNQTVLTDGPDITQIGPRAEVDVPSGSRKVELLGGVLIPGLVDTHIHLRQADSTALAEYLRAGITTAREMNGRPSILGWRDRIEAGELIGPTLQVAAPTLANFSSPREGYPTPESAEDAATIVRRFKNDGYDLIKVYTFLPKTSFFGVMAEAANLGIPVAGHVPVSVEIKETITSGIRSIEHLTEYVGSSLTPGGVQLDEDFRSLFGAGEIDWPKLDSLVAMTLAAGVWNVPTLVWFDRNLPAPIAEDAWSKPELRAEGKSNRREIVRRLYEAGAPLALGTDSDAGRRLPADAIHDEIVAMVDAGIDPGAVLRLATAGGAKLMGIDESVGTVSVGKRADLLLLRCDPRADLSCLREPVVIMARGRVVNE